MIKPNEPNESNQEIIDEINTDLDRVLDALGDTLEFILENYYPVPGWGYFAPPDDEPKIGGE